MIIDAPPSSPAKKAMYLNPDGSSCQKKFALRLLLQNDGSIIKGEVVFHPASVDDSFYPTSSSTAMVTASDIHSDDDIKNTKAANVASVNIGVVAMFSTMAPKKLNSVVDSQAANEVFDNAFIIAAKSVRVGKQSFEVQNAGVNAVRKLKEKEQKQRVGLQRRLIDETTNGIIPKSATGEKFSKQMQMQMRALILQFETTIRLI